MSKCPSCGKAELNELVPGVMSCPSCRKMFKGELPPEAEQKIEEGEIVDGSVFQDDTALNDKYEVADCGITVSREKIKHWFAVLICHSPDFPSLKYVRLSWWKNSNNAHHGMFRLNNMGELDNLIESLKRMKSELDETFNTPNESIPGTPPFQNRSINIEPSDIFDVDKHICPKCNHKMKRSTNKRYFECEICGEIIVIYEGKPLMELPPETLPLTFSVNFPINYYLPFVGITVSQTMVDWKAVVVIYAKENPDRRWLRFYWWQRDLQQYISQMTNLAMSQSLKWDAKKGSGSTNLYNHEQIPLLIQSLEKIKRKWQEMKNPELSRTGSEDSTRNSDEGMDENLSVAVPSIRESKVTFVEWIVKNDPENQYKKKDLIRLMKPELSKIAENIASKLQEGEM